MLQQTENLILKKLFSVPQIRNKILVKNNFKPKLDDLPTVEYLCKCCQVYQNLPKWEKEWEYLDFDHTDELEENYCCPCCGDRMVQTETGDW